MIPEDLVPVDCPWPIVLGIDPGTRVVGFGAILLAGQAPRLLACGVLRAPRADTVAVRLGRLQEELERLLARLRPSCLALEGAFTARNVQSALRIGEARGIVLACAARVGIEVTEISPATAKKAVVGHGAGTKEQVARLVGKLLASDELGVPRDATDALALALALANRLRLRARIGAGAARFRLAEIHPPASNGRATR